MAAYPSSIPSPMGSIAGKVLSELNTFTSESKRRIRTGPACAMLMPCTFSWYFLPDEFATFLNWWKVTQNYGASPFTIDMLFGGSSRTITAQFTDTPKIQRATQGWRVTVPTTIIVRPSGVSASWVSPFLGPPATFPYAEAGIPQMGYTSEEAQNLLATDGYPYVAAASMPVGTDYSFTWVLTGLAFDYILEWYSKALRFGQRKFVASFGDLGAKLYTVVSDAQFSVNGVDFRFSLKVQATDYAASGGLGYVFNRAQDYAVDIWTNRAEDSAADRKINEGQA